MFRDRRRHTIRRGVSHLSSFKLLVNVVNEVIENVFEHEKRLSLFFLLYLVEQVRKLKYTLLEILLEGNASFEVGKYAF